MDGPNEPQIPRDEQRPGPQPRIGVDEWVATHGERRERRTDALGRVAEAWGRLPVWAPLLFVVAVGAIFPFLTDSDYIVRVGFNALIFATLALGLNIVVGYAGLLDLGYIAFFGFGAYVYAILSSNKFDLHLPTIAALPIVIAASALLGLLLGLPSRRLTGDYLAIVTLFFAQIFVTFTTNANRIRLPGTDETFDLTGGPNGIGGVDPFSLFGIEAIEVTTYFYLALGLVTVAVVGFWLLERSRTGRAWKAVREDPLAAEAMTIPVNRVKLMAFAFGAATAGLTGSLFAAQQIGVFPQNFELPLLITIYAMVILGGAGSIHGVVIGAMTIIVLLEVLRGPAEARLLFYVALLAALVGLMRPWRRLAIVLAATLAFGYAVRFLVGSMWERGTARVAAEGHGLLGGFVESWLLLPTEPGTIANVAFVVLIACVLALTLLKGWARVALLVPTLYLAAFVWENRLIFQPSVTRLLVLGALLVVLMNARPQGLFGTTRVEIT